MQYAEMIMNIRKRLDISQEELARQLDVSFATVNRWETGKCKPSRMAIKALDKYCLEHNIRDLIDGSGINADKRADN